MSKLQIFLLRWIVGCVMRERVPVQFFRVVAEASHEVFYEDNRSSVIAFLHDQLDATNCHD